MADLELQGVDASTVAGYLTALGVFRAVAKQHDPDSTLRWRKDNVPVLDAPSIENRDQLLAWIWNQYRPSPIASPWNSGAGFHGSSRKITCSDGIKRHGVDLVLCSTDKRLSAYRHTLEKAQRILEKLDAQHPKSVSKADLLRTLRAQLPDSAIDWLDAAVVLQAADDPGFLAMLGTGGNDGRLDLSNNFMLRMCALLPFEGNLAKRPRNADSWSQALLGSALFGEFAAGEENASAGQLAPSSRSAPNGSSGSASFFSKEQSNPWTFLWTIEGSLWFAGAATKRLAAHGRARAAFPFHLGRAGADFGTAGATENGKDELWLPLWGAPAGWHELRALFGEARAQVGRRRATSGVDFARAIASLGEFRGLRGFRRFSILERAGKSNLTVGLRSYRAGRSTRIDLLRQLDPWLARFERIAGIKETPPRFTTAWRRFEDTTLILARHDSAHAMGNVVAALGVLEQERALNPKLDSLPKPLRLTGNDWIHACDDGSTEYRIACAVSGLDAGGHHAPWIDYIRESTRSHTKVVGAARMRLVDLLVAVMFRRLIEYRKPAEDNSEPAMPTRGRSSVTGSDMRKFISGSTQDTRILALLWSLGTLPPSTFHGSPTTTESDCEPTLPAELPRSWIMQRIALLGWIDDRRPGGRTAALRVDPCIARLVQAQQHASATSAALRRLHAGGFAPLPVESHVRLSTVQAQRHVAAFAVPVSARTEATFLHAVTSRPFVDETHQHGHIS